LCACLLPYLSTRSIASTLHKIHTSNLRLIKDKAPLLPLLQVSELQPSVNPFHQILQYHLASLKGEHRGHLRLLTKLPYEWGKMAKDTTKEPKRQLSGELGSKLASTPYSSRHSDIPVSSLEVSLLNASTKAVTISASHSPIS